MYSLSYVVSEISLHIRKGGEVEGYSGGERERERERDIKRGKGKEGGKEEREGSSEGGSICADRLCAEDSST